MESQVLSRICKVLNKKAKRQKSFDRKENILHMAMAINEIDLFLDSFIENLRIRRKLYTENATNFRTRKDWERYHTSLGMVAGFGMLYQILTDQIEDRYTSWESVSDLSKNIKSIISSYSLPNYFEDEYGKSCVDLFYKKKEKLEQELVGIACGEGPVIL